MRLALVKLLSLTGQAGLLANLARKLGAALVKHRTLDLRKGYCCICGRQTWFWGLPQVVRETYWCGFCSSSTRNRHVAWAILRHVASGQYPSLRAWAGSPAARQLKVWQLQAQGPLHWALRGLPGYVCSEYIEGIPSGDVVCGIRCEDVQHTSFGSETLDLVISEDVLEHVADPHRAFREIRRTLRPSGYHIFSVPLREGPTLQRATIRNGKVVNLLPPVFHDDPLSGGSLVFTDWGIDVCSQLADLGFTAWLERVDNHGLGIYDSCIVVSSKDG